MRTSRITSVEVDVCFGCSVLAHITQPLDCLIPNLHLQLESLEKYRQSPERMCQIPYKLVELETVVEEIQCSLRKIKVAFAKSDVTSIIFQKVRSAIKEVRPTCVVVTRFTLICSSYLLCNIIFSQPKTNFPMMCVTSSTTCSSSIATSCTNRTAHPAANRDNPN